MSIGNLLTKRNSCDRFKYFTQGCSDNCKMAFGDSVAVKISLPVVTPLTPKLSKIAIAAESKIVQYG
jgi:hypothetical protein